MGYSFQPLGDGRYRVSGVRISPTTGKYITQKSKEEHMSNIETVEVPVEALRKLRAWYRLPADSYGAQSGLSELLKIELPDPIKVGDTITGEQFATLPVLSVAIDGDGDVWVRGDDAFASTVMFDQFDGVMTEEDAYLAGDLLQGTVVHIGREA